MAYSKRRHTDSVSFVEEEKKIVPSQVFKSLRRAVLLL